MASVNKVILVGHLGKDPEVRTFPSGDRVANVTVATSERWKDKQTNEAREATEWHRVVFRGGLAGIVEQYLRKGSQVYVEGSIRTRKYTDKDGVERSISEIVASEMTMLGSRQGTGGPSGEDDGGGYGGGASSHSNSGGGYSRPAPASRPAPQAPQQAPRQAAAPAKSASGFDDMDDDIPF